MVDILSGDIKLMKPQVLLDTNDGGGAMTRDEIIDGQSNNLFSDIDEIDRVYGRVSVRKAFVYVQTLGTPSAFQMHLIVAKKPTDPNVSVNLFTTDDWFDRRNNAQNRIESYLAKGVKWEGHLLETQIVGQRAIQLSLDVNSQNVPNNGATLVLISNEGKTTEKSQYVRVTEITKIEVRSFEVNGKTYQRKLVTCSISDALRYDFEGQTVAQFINGNTTIAFARETRVADASKYYGISTLTHNVLLGAAKITVDSIFTQLVPSAQVETPIVDINAAGQDVSLVASNSGAITIAKNFTVNSSQGLYIGSAILPKTLSFSLFGSAIKDSGGELKNTSGVVIGTIDYQNGLINWNSNAGTGSTTTTFSFTPAALPTKPQSTRLLRVTAENRGYNWIASLLPIPSPATLIVSYVAQGKVYTLRDNGAGQLKGSDNAFGSGTISYETGTMVLTTGEMPDVDTGILIAWGNNLSVFERSSMPISKAYIDLNFDSDAIIAGSLTVKWLLNGVEKTATDTGTGQITGDATGTIDYANGTAKLMPKLLPNGGTTFNITGSKGEKKTTDISVTPSSGVMEFDIPGTNPLTPNSITLGVPVVSADSKSGFVQLYDRNVDGVTGNLVNGVGEIQGTINYNTRHVSVTPKALYEVIRTYYSATATYGAA